MMQLHNVKLNWISAAFICLFLMGAALRAVNIWRPIDTSSWREPDVAGIARNYYREGMNPFAPRIDWRGNGPGYVESEFPIYPWTIAVLYKLFGIHETFGRVLAYIFSLLSLFVFIKLARYLLPDTGALVASVFFALSALPIKIAVTIQPDGLMFLFYLTAAYAFIRWLDDNTTFHYALSLTATVFALLVKINAAHIGLLFAVLALSKFGWSAFRNTKLWLFAVIALLPTLFWYGYARHLWLSYGNSLGISNQDHWAGWHIFTDPSFVTELTRINFAFVWMPAGVFLAAWAAWRKWQERPVKYALIWLAAIWVLYLLAARTLSQGWAFYYHVVSAPPFALLIGAAATDVRLVVERRHFRRVIIALVSLTVISGVIGVTYLNERWSPWAIRVATLTGSVATLSFLFQFFRSDEKTSSKPTLQSYPQTTIQWVLIIALAWTFNSQLRRLQEALRWERSDVIDCAANFKPHLMPNDLILASGGNCRGASNQVQAYYASYMFYWLDHKGFSICVEEQSLEKVKEIARRGAKYFVAEKWRLRAIPGFEDALRQSYPVVAECDRAIMFDLSQPKKIENLKRVNE